MRANILSQHYPVNQITHYQQVDLENSNQLTGVLGSSNVFGPIYKVWLYVSIQIRYTAPDIRVNSRGIARHIQMKVTQ